MSTVINRDIADYDTAAMSVNYIIDRSGARMAKDLDLAEGDALMMTIAVLDEDLYAKVLGSKVDSYGFHNNTDAGRDRICDLVDYMASYFEKMGDK